MSDSLSPMLIRIVAANDINILLPEVDNQRKFFKEWIS